MPTSALTRSCFNEAAGIHRRKREFFPRTSGTSVSIASMRPPEFTGGNGHDGDHGGSAGACFNEAAGIHRRKRDALNTAIAEQGALQ